MQMYKIDEDIYKSNNTNSNTSNLTKEVGFELLDRTQQRQTEKSTKDPFREYQKTTWINNLVINLSQCTLVQGLTLTLKKKYHRDEIITMHKYIQNKIYNSTVWKGTIYCLRPELTKNNILHYHAIIYNNYEAQTDRLVKWWRREFGFVKPEFDLKYPIKWIEYMFKDYCKIGLWTIHTIPYKKILVDGSNSNA